MEDLLIYVREEPDPEVYTQEEWINQVGLSPMAFADLNEEKE